MGYEVVLDIETENSFGQLAVRSTQAKGRGRDNLLKVSLVGIYRYDTGVFETYLETELAKLWPVLEHADRIIGFNSDAFDLPILDQYYPGSLKRFTSLDLMVELTKKLGFRVGLDAVAQGTLGVSKSGDGLQAIKLWHEGRIAELKQYCLDDVKLTRDVYEFGKANGSIKYQNKLGSGTVKVDFSLPSDIHKANLTLPL